jgi:hypothetical protein
MGRLRSFVADLNEMTAEETAALVNSLYQFHDSVFCGVDEAAFGRAMINSHAQLNKIKVVTDESGKICGYCAVHRADRLVSHGSVSVFKVEMGVSREYRGRALLRRFVGNQFRHHFLRHPFRKTFFLSAFVHPASYRTAAGVVWKLYPNRRHPTPPQMERLMNELADALDYARDDERPWTRKVGWISRDDDKDRAYWETQSHPDIRYFLERNPDYSRGNGLLSIMPLTPANIAITFAIGLRERLKRKLGIRTRTYAPEPRPTKS